MPVNFKVNVIPPVEPQIELTIAGVRNFTKIDDSTVQIVMPLTVIRALQAQLEAALAAAGIPPATP